MRGAADPIPGSGDAGAHSQFDPAEPGWLALRFNADARSRAPELLQRVLRVGAPLPFRVLDLGAGSGAHLAYLAPRLPHTRQQWALVDRDSDLLGIAPGFARSQGFEVSGDHTGFEVALDRRRVRVETRTLDFLASPETLREGWDLITANAVFDLVSQSGLEQFVDQLTQLDAPPPVYFTLNLDSPLEFSPSHPLDRDVVAAFHNHMRRRQRGGRALGPASSRELARALRGRGWRVWTEPSDWSIPSGESAFLRANLDFIAAAVPTVIQMQSPGGPSLDAFADWLQMRRAQIANRSLTARVSHGDHFALPPRQ